MDEANRVREKLTLVARKGCFGLPTACPSCLPVYIYLRLANVPFDIEFNLINPQADEIPYVESGDYVAYNNEKGGVIEALKEDGMVDLDSEISMVSEWISTKAMICSWLSAAVTYELWLGSDGSSAHKIYYSDLPWPVGKLLYLKQMVVAKQVLGITNENAERKSEEIYRNATFAYKALSARLGEQSFFFENRPTSLDAIFLGHALFTLQALPLESLVTADQHAAVNMLIRGEYVPRPWPCLGEAVGMFLSSCRLQLLCWICKKAEERSNHHLLHNELESSVLRSKLAEHNNLLRYADSKAHLLVAGSPFPSVPSSHSDPSSSASRQGPSNRSNFNDSGLELAKDRKILSGSKPKTKPKREKTQEERTFKRRSKYFLLTQLVGVLVFLSLLGGSEDTEDYDS
ncbi:hypothetical protein RJ639_016080 [Escallonia herrerae]|uniref:Metaxin n=1 Tax=Escallonia herrerae TaxID=1293975 RepID=A0AA89AJS6_9ASTE|nr:hypothetical protein RJ639_016080 [Escallonia herrerae]